MRRIFITTVIGLLALQGQGFAAEAGISSYTLGSAAFGAGIVPPAGTYVTPVTGFYSGTNDDAVNIGGLPLDPGAEMNFFKTGINALYVPDAPVLGGALGLSAMVAGSHIDFSGTALSGLVEAQVEGWGVTDTSLKAQLGWGEGSFFHNAYVMAILPTGRYDTGLYPSTGLGRAALDAGWGFTWVEPSTMIQFNGQLGFTYNFNNDATDYQSGTEAHFEWAVGKDFAPGLTLGLVGYNYRQLTGDSGTGAMLGDYKGSVDAVGVGASYLTPVGLFGLRHYQEFGAENHFEGTSTMATVSFAF